MSGLWISLPPVDIPLDLRAFCFVRVMIKRICGCGALDVDYTLYIIYNVGCVSVLWIMLDVLDAPTELFLFGKNVWLRCELKDYMGRFCLGESSII